MSIQAVLLPVFVQVALTFLVLFWLGRRRGGAIRSAEFKAELAPIDDRAWPVPVRQASNALRNQFELPVLFYVLVVLAVVTRKADILFVVLSWIFVISRIAHALVHIGNNDVRLRFPLYAAGVLVLLVMWVLFTLAILLAPVIP